MRGHAERIVVVPDTSSRSSLRAPISDRSPVSGLAFGSAALAPDCNATLYFIHWRLTDIISRPSFTSRASTTGTGTARWTTMLKTLVALLSILAHGLAQLNTSCVQIMDSTAADASPYPDTEPSLTFTMEGVTDVQSNTINVVLVVDGSPSIEADEWILEKEFAKDTVAAFADRKIFENGGTASFAQFSGYTTDEGTFNSTESFNAHVDSVDQFGSGTNIVSGIETGKELLDSVPSSYGFMILITDGEHNGYGDVAATAEEARADNTTTIFAVGVDVSPESLLEIAGDESNVFDVTDFNAVSAALAGIQVIADLIVVRCLASDVLITVEFDAEVTSVGSPGAAIVGDNRVIFTADNLEENPTQFAVGLKTCGDVVSVEYEDDQGNVPDFSKLPEPTCPPASGPGRVSATLGSICVVGAILIVSLGSLFGGSKGSSTVVWDNPAGDGKLLPPNNMQHAGGTSDRESVEQRGAVIADRLVPDASPDEDAAAATIAVGENIPGASSPTTDAARAAGPPELPARNSPADIVNTGVPSGDGEGRDEANASGGGSDAVRQVALPPVITSLRSARSPSSTLAWLLIVQVQFLAVLSLVDSVGSGHSWLADFLRHLRWINLWVSFTPDSEDEVANSEEDNDIGKEEFIGNIVLSCCIGLLILALHLVVVSAIEACWLQRTKSRAYPEGRIDFEEEGPPPSYEEMTGASSKSAAMRATAVDKEAVAKCRERSKSIWIHFPHVELAFLLYAVEGSLAAQVAVLRRDGGDGTFYTAAIALVVYPAFLLIMMLRVIHARVVPDTSGIGFTLTEKDDFFSAGSRRSCRAFFSRVLRGLKEEHSAFAWAKKGMWATAFTQDPKERRLLDWFHIGFQPLFADFTQDGSWFAVYALLETYLTACVGVLLDSNSQLQLLIFMGLHAMGYVLVLWRRPYANRVINIMDACRRGINAICMAMLVAAEAEDGRVHEKNIETAVAVIELFLLWALAMPIYVDNTTVLFGAISRRIQKTAICCGCCGCCGTRRDLKEAAGPAERFEATDRCVPHDWPAAWYKMIGRNLTAYKADVANGFRRKPRSA